MTEARPKVIGHRSNCHKRIWVGGRMVLEHRHFMELHLGRKLRRDEVVHHRNNDPRDNRIENLEVMSKRDHDRMNPTVFRIGHRDSDPQVAARRKQIEELASRGFSFGEIAKIVGVHRGTVQHYLRREQVRASRARRRSREQ